MKSLLRLVLLPFCIVAACDDDESKPADTGGDASDVSGDADAPSGDADAAPDVPDDRGGDAVPDADTGQPGDLALTYAFSPDGRTIGLLFSAEMNATVGADLAHYQVVASNDQQMPLRGAEVEGDFVELELDDELDAELAWEVVVDGLVAADDTGLDPEASSAPVMATVYLNLVWHQHQPSYMDPAQDELQGPWVRKHATKDYFDMTAIVAGFPDIHFNMNLTSSLLNQLDLYIDRLGPYVDVEENTIDEEDFLAEYAGRTDPWIDLLLEDTPAPDDATEEQLGRFYADVWSTRSVAEPLRAFFPEYLEILNRDGSTYTQLDLLYLKLFFEIAWMDPSFLDGPVTVYHDDALDVDVVVDLSDVVNQEEDGTYVLDDFYTSGDEADLLARGELLANRLVAENYKIMRGVYAIHTELLYSEGEGQVEVLTTPFFHPILPLLFDTDLAAEGQPNDPRPDPAFSYPEDVDVQIGMAVDFYERRFGVPPTGMWPSEGSVAEEIIPAFVDNGIRWIATDRRVLERGMEGASHLYPYRIDADTVDGDGGDTDDDMMIVFRDTALSDAVGFQYQGNPGQANADDFVLQVRSVAPAYGETDRLLSVVLDGENAWEWYTQDHDAKDFFQALYTNMELAFERRMIVMVTGSEFIDGNEDRDVPAHPLSGLDEYEDLFPGSWIDGTFATWIGELEENIGWTYLRTAREAADAAGAALADDVTLGASLLDAPDESDVASYNWWRALMALYAAEGSDWFWWYGSDQTAAGGDDTPFDEIYRSQLRAFYEFANLALNDAGETPLEVPGFPPVLQPAPARLDGPFTTLPTLDGALTPDESEWIPPAGDFWDNDTSGADIDEDDDIRRVIYGFQRLAFGDAVNLFFAIELNEDAADMLGTSYRLAIYTSHGNLEEGEDGPEVVSDPANDATEEGVETTWRGVGPARQILLDFSGETIEASLSEADGEGGWDSVADTIEVAGPTGDGTVIELKVPLSELGMANLDPLELLVVAAEEAETWLVIDVAPNLGTQEMFTDPTKLVEVIFELDATGTQIPISEFITIVNPPPPDGDGHVSIVGNQDAFANWDPNMVAMTDDGEGADLIAGDNIWTRSFQFSPGVGLQYKYTIGHEGDDWGGTEEYPLTNRGYSVPVDGTRRVRIRDVFADRPDPSGSMADLTQVMVEE